MEKVKVNIILITYNQEDFVKQATKSILEQETNFKFDIVVADDMSTDQTKSIIKELATTSEIDFHFLETNKNIGYTQNYKKAFAYCSAPYIAIMEGDDYWTSSNHLQNHIDFLEAHPNCMMSFNRHERIFVDKGYNDIPQWSIVDDFKMINPKDLALGNLIGNLSCCVFRNIKVKSEIFDSIFFADWLLGLYLGLSGDLAQQKDVTSAYRVHDNGQWSRMSETEQYHTLLKMIDCYNPLLDYVYNDEFTLYRKRINVHLYGDKTLKGRIKNMLPKSIYKKYKKWRYE